MTNTTYCLSWDSHKSSICKGFTQLQQSEEFVDMTLVAEGHLVRVHKNLISLASPYIKNIIKATPCDHPIIFLINITHTVLQQILEYIYTGEVHVDIAKLNDFINAARELQLPGIANDFSFETNVSSGQDNSTREEVNNEKKVQILNDRILKYGSNDAAVETNSNQALDIHIASLNNDNDHHEIAKMEEIESFNEFIKFSDTSNSIINNIDSSEQCSNLIDKIEGTKDSKHPEVSLEIDLTESMPQQYTMSNRGSLQMILNRYIYNMHYSAWSEQKRRWRCIDYRLLHCKAYVDTHNDKITKRMNCHTHAFHDGKIMKKVKARLIFGSLSNAILKATRVNKCEKVIESD